MEGVTVTIRDVQAVLLNMFSNKTILIGHSLESDFKALKVNSTKCLTSLVLTAKLLVLFSILVCVLKMKKFA